MSSIYDFPKMPMPYPEQNPWYDLSSLVLNGWAADPKDFPFMAKIDGNEISIYLRTRRGTDRFITSELPDEIIPAGDRVFGAYAAAPGDIAFWMRTDGRTQIFSITGSYATLTDGSLSNYVVESTYLRRAS